MSFKKGKQELTNGSPNDWKKKQTAEQNLKKLRDNIQLHNIYLFRFPKWEREKEVEDI